MAGVCLKFRPGLIKKTIEAMCVDAEAVWPTSGEMIAKLHQAAVDDEAEHGVKQSLKRRSHRTNANINGWRYDQIIKRTKAGRQAVRDGNPNSFLMRLVDGHQDLPQEMEFYPGTRNPVDA